MGTVRSGHTPVAAGFHRIGRARVLTTALAALVLIALGFAAGWLTPTLRAPDDGSAEAGFARDMSVHHAQAVHMAFVEYDRGGNQTVRRLAYDMATSQQYQIGVMETWLTQWGLPLTSDKPRMGWVPGGSAMLQPDGRMPGMPTNDEMKRLENASGRDADVLFCQLMIRHHLGGIHMIDAVLKQTNDKRVRELAESMRVGQQGEVDILERLARDLSEPSG